MKNAQEKIKKTSKLIYIGLMIGKVSSIAGLVLTGFALVCGLVGRGDIQSWIVDLEGYANTEVTMVLIPAMLCVLIAAFAVTAAICGQLGRMFRDIQAEGIPFAAKHAVRIKRVAWLALALSVLAGTAENLERAILTGDNMVLVSLDLAMVVFAGVIYCLAYIFDYGCRLQQESDETL